jgi:uncharacterized protein
VTRVSPDPFNLTSKYRKMSLTRIMQTTGPNRVAKPKDPSRDLITMTRFIESGYGRISVAYSLPKAQTPSVCLLIAHGVKGSMNSSLVTYFHTALAAQGFLTVKFNFPYAEGRMRLLSKPDNKEALVDCYCRVVDSVAESEWKPRDMFLGGISLGAAIASHVVSDRPNIPEVKGLFFLSYPLHRPGMPDARGDRHLHKISKPMLFVTGTRDPYAEPRALKSTLSALGDRAQVYWVEGGEQTFDKKKGKEIHSKTLREIVETITQWVHSKTPTKTRTE